MPGRGRQPHAGVVLGAILVLAAALRLINLNAEYWFDEIVTVRFWAAPAPIADLLTQYYSAGHHVLYSLLMNVVTAAGGTEPWVARLPAVAFGVAGVWAFWFVARQLWPRVPALIGTGLFSVSFHHIYYSQNARGYTALLFFGLLATGLAIRLSAPDPVERRTRMRDLASYAVSVALGLYAMVLMVFIVMAHGCVMLACRRWRVLAALAAGVGLSLLFYAPMIGPLVEFHRVHTDQTGHLVFSMEFVRTMAPVGAVLILGALVAVPLSIRLWRRHPLATALLLLPVAFNVIVPLARQQGVYPRSFMFALAIGYLVQIELIDWARSIRPVLAWIWVAVVVVASAAQLAPYYRLPKQGFRQALAYVDAHRAPADDRIALTLTGKVIDFYDPSVVAVNTAEELRVRLSQEQRPAWIVSTFPDQMRAEEPDLHRWLESRSPVARFPGVIADGTVEVRYWVPPPASGRD